MFLIRCRAKIRKTFEKLKMRQRAVKPARRTPYRARGPFNSHCPVQGSETAVLQTLLWTASDFRVARTCESGSPGRVPGAGCARLGCCANPPGCSRLRDVRALIVCHASRLFGAGSGYGNGIAPPQRYRHRPTQGGETWNAPVKDGRSRSSNPHCPVQGSATRP